MVNILYIQMEARGIQRHVLLLVLDTYCIHHFEKGIIERTIEYFKDRTENFDNYYPCKSKVYHHMVHVYNWMSLFVFMHNSDIQHIRFMALAHLMRGDGT